MNVAERVCAEGACTPIMFLEIIISVRFAIPTGIAKQMKRRLNK
jgi:hypothetical protein